MVDVGVGELRRSRDRLAKQGEAAEQAGENTVSGLLLFYPGAHVHSSGDSVASGIPHRGQPFAWSFWQT